MEFLSYPQAPFCFVGKEQEKKRERGAWYRVDLFETHVFPSTAPD